MALARIGGAVLAGGRSRRMGRTKALIEIDGVAMADRVLTALRSVGADPVVVYGGDGAELAELSAPVVPDAFPGRGPVGGVLGVLEHLGDEVDSVLVLPCDVAMIDRTTLAPIVAAATGRPGHIAVARTDRIEPMVAIWPTAVRTRIAELFDSGERALHRIIEQLDHTDVDVDARGLVNFNTPDDLPGARS